jgi:hypothetical protein
VTLSARAGPESPAIASASATNRYKARRIDAPRSAMEWARRYREMSTSSRAAEPLIRPVSDPRLDGVVMPPLTRPIEP